MYLLNHLLLYRILFLMLLSYYLYPTDTYQVCLRIACF
uniref:Uncharacterized protein n=1 Tax=Podoviridae sp. ctG4L18 TaxID=2825234 RepID=A0A8S5UP05_9CAUD|nr:MAG TPA: hypothetical protein [Podoviridae sp. ctG4L18]DAO74410.1 MAG TPA: hypothetical protein [Bacteriophage sp.]